jgi:hypothetical protein
LLRKSSIVRGVEASALGTLAFDAFLFRRYRRGGGGASFFAWESSEGVDGWESAAAPALVAKKALERAIGRDVPARFARSLNNLMHWGYGLGAGAAYGLVIGSGRPRLWYGLPFGAAVWAAGYVVLPRFRVYEEIWKYDLETLEKDLSAHLVFGTATAAAFTLLTLGRKGDWPQGSPR